MRLSRRTLRFVPLAFLGLFLIVPVSSISTSCYNRWQAGRLLKRVRQIRPGKTTEAEAKQLLLPFRHYEPDYFHPDARHPSDFYEFNNYPTWLISLADHVPFEWRQHLRYPLPGTALFVSLPYQDNLVLDLRVNFGQEEQFGFVHPIACVVKIYSQRGEAVDVSLPKPFSGYTTHRQATRAVGPDGFLRGPEFSPEVFIEMDERASDQQRKDALTFHLACMTSWRRCSTVEALRYGLR